MGLVGSRPLPPPLVKGAAYHDPRRLPSVRHPFSLEAAPRAGLATRSGCPPLAILSLCLRVREAVSDCDPKSATYALTRGHEPCSSSLSSPRAGLSSGPRRAVVLLRATHPGEPRRICAVVRDVPCGTPVRPLPRCRVSRPRRLLLRARPAPATGRERRVSPERCVRRRSPPLFHPAPPGSAFFRRVADRPEMTSRRATWAEACETKDLSAPTPQGSGARRVPLLAGGPERPLSSPRVRTWLEGHLRLGDREPGATEIPARVAPREGDDAPEDQDAWNRSVGRSR